MSIGIAVLLLALQAQPGQASLEPSSGAISNVAVSPAFFNPSLGQRASITFTTTAPGTATVYVLDRDGFPIRGLSQISGAAGEQRTSWDGRDNDGTIAPDEAYCLRILFNALDGNAPKAVYDPRTRHQPEVEEPREKTYSRLDGALIYTLKNASRVHIQAGEAVLNPKTGKPEGPFLKTLVDRQPRIAGAVVEKWNGFDESGTIHVADLPHFAVSILAVSLPENSLITIGNKSLKFLDYVRARRPAEACAPRQLSAEGHARHRGLTEFEDHSPDLKLEVSARVTNGVAHLEEGLPLTIKLTLDPKRAPYFLMTPHGLDVYLNGKSIYHRKSPHHPARASIPASSLPKGDHRLAVNWDSKLGPSAVQAIRLIVTPRGTEASSTRGRP